MNRAKEVKWAMMPMIILVIAFCVGFSWHTYNEGLTTRSAMENGYEQVVEPRWEDDPSPTIIWRKKDATEKP